MRARLVFLFRYFKVDTVLVYDPSGLYERNPDHYITARAVGSPRKASAFRCWAMTRRKTFSSRERFSVSSTRCCQAP